jgi:hypothetical protein
MLSSKPCIHGCEILKWISITASYSTQAALAEIPAFCGDFVE